MRAVSRRRSEASSPSAESTPLARGQRIRSIPSSAAIAAACIGPAPPNGISAKPPRVDPALDRDHAQRADHLLVGDPDDPLGRGPSGSSPSSVAEAPDRRLGRAPASSSTPPARLESELEVAEQQVRVGHRRLARRRARSRRARARRPPSAVRRAGRRPCRASRSSRRRRRPCARRPSAAGSPGRRSGASRCGAPGRPRPRRRRRRCRPCRSRARCRRPRAAASSPAPTAPPAGPGEHAPGPGRAASAAGATPPEDIITAGSGSPRSRGASPSRPR